MSKTVISILVFLSLQIIVLCQTRIDVIHLKNGDIFKGEIIEYVPNDYVKIEIQGGSVFTVKYSDILKFSKEKISNDEHQTQLENNSNKSIDKKDGIDNDFTSNKKSFGIGFQYSFPTYGFSLVLPISQNISLEGILNVLGDIKSYGGRLYYYLGNKFYYLGKTQYRFYGFAGAGVIKETVLHYQGTYYGDYEDTYTFYGGSIGVGCQSFLSPNFAVKGDVGLCYLRSEHYAGFSKFASGNQSRSEPNYFIFLYGASLHYYF